MDYRITFVYQDASSHEVYASTETDVQNLVGVELRKTLSNPVHNHTVSIHVANIALQE